MRSGGREEEPWSFYLAFIGAAIYGLHGVNFYPHRPRKGFPENDFLPASKAHLNIILTLQGPLFVLIVQPQ